jgi:hypothetical protein
MNPESLVRALVTQFICDSAVPSALVDFWKGRKKGRETPKTSDLIQVLGEVLVAKARRICFVVIDALDESNEDEGTEVLLIVRSIPLLDNIRKPDIG